MIIMFFFFLSLLFIYFFFQSFLSVDLDALFHSSLQPFYAIGFPLLSSAFYYKIIKQVYNIIPTYLFPIDAQKSAIIIYSQAFRYLLYCFTQWVRYTIILLSYEFFRHILLNYNIIACTESARNRLCVHDYINILHYNDLRTPSNAKRSNT